MRRSALFLLLGLSIASVCAAETLPADRPVGKLETVALFRGPMPTGVTVSRRGRIFVNFPRWGDPVQYTVAELKGGRTLPFPPGPLARTDRRHPADTLISVQSVVVDPRDRLWLLDTGSIQFGPPLPGGAKLVGVDLQRNRVFKKILFPDDVALPSSYLNDVRFDLRRGKAGMAFITDSSGTGPNGIVVVDLASGRSWRRLHDHPSTKAEPMFRPSVEGRTLMNRQPGKPPSFLTLGSDGIAISADGERLFYCPLASRRLYSVSVDALADEQNGEDQAAATVRDHGEKGASDGLDSDSQGRIYVTDYETNSIRRRRGDGDYETLVHDPRVLWPDTLCVAEDGYLYFTANQLHRQARFHDGRDEREKPYVLFRTRINAQPVRLH